MTIHPESAHGHLGPHAPPAAPRRDGEGVSGPRAAYSQARKPARLIVDREPHALYNASKRTVDLLGASLLLLALTPAIVLVAFGILLTGGRGPIFFRQERTGRNGQRFPMLKFRTMVHNASELKEHYRHLNELSGPDFKIRRDPRVTAFGRFLRRSSLDEVPNLFNVIRGEMSLVGPRPTSFDVSTYQEWHLPRLAVQPGLTGLWQVEGRSDLDFDARVELDLEYVERRNLWLDLKLIVLTPWAVLHGRGAY